MNINITEHKLNPFLLLVIATTVTSTSEEVDRQKAAEEAHEKRDNKKKDESKDKRSHPVKPGTCPIMTTLHRPGTHHIFEVDRS